MKTENIEHIGSHAFEVAGLGLAPFRFVGASENVITYPDGTQKAGGSCDYCGTGIRTECWVKSSDGKQFKVGCNCIEKVGDNEQIKALINANREKLASMPHPYGFNDRQTGKPLTYLDQVEWLLSNCGASGRAGLLKGLKRTLSEQPATA